MHMHSNDNRPTIEQRERWLLQAIAVACSITVAAIGLCIANMTLRWPHGLMPIVALMGSVAWTGVMALAVMVGIAKLVGELQDELNADHRQRRTDEIAAELDNDDPDDVRLADDVTLHRMRR